MYNFEALNDTDRKQMLSSIGVDSIEELFEVIPNNAKMEKLDLEDGIDEIDVQFKLRELASKNKTEYFIYNNSSFQNSIITNRIQGAKSTIEYKINQEAEKNAKPPEQLETPKQNSDTFIKIKEAKEMLDAGIIDENEFKEIKSKLIKDM